MVAPLPPVNVRIRHEVQFYPMMQVSWMDLLA